MATLVVYENGKTTDVTTTTNRYLHSYTRNKYYGYNLLAWCFFLLKNSMRISTLLDRKCDFKFSRSTGRSIISTVLLCFKLTTIIFISHPVKWGYMRCRDLDTHYCRHYYIDTQRERTYEHSAIHFITRSSYKRKGWVQLISTFIFDIVNCMSHSYFTSTHNTSIIQRCIYLCHYNILLSLIPQEDEDSDAVSLLPAEEIPLPILPQMESKFRVFQDNINKTSEQLASPLPEDILSQDIRSPHEHTTSIEYRYDHPDYQQWSI